MHKVTIIGKNSRLYKNLKTSISNKFHVVEELSHSDISRCTKILNPIVFSFSPNNFISNADLIDEIYSKLEGSLTYISTSAVLACATSIKYKYPRVKKEIENYLLKKENITILRVGVVEDLINKSCFFGRIKLSSSEIIVQGLFDAFNSDNKIINCWKEVFLSNNMKNSFIYSFEMLLFKFLKKRFYLSRPFDIIFKLIKYNNYGYTFLSNEYNENDIDQVVIGSGMAAMGVVNAISEKSLLNLDKTLLIESFNNPFKHTDANNDKKGLEFKGFGGNSNFWHGVISKYIIGNEAHNLLFKKWFNLFYNISDELLDKGYSFVPKYPLRPRKLVLRKIKKQNHIQDTVIFIERDLALNRYIIHTTYNTFVSRNLFVCSGTFSSMQLLFDSGLMKSGDIQIDDHMVGYFAQLKLDKRKVLEKPIHYKSGHFKKFHTIKLDDKRSLYVNLRPAYLSFQDISEASKYRDFFSQRSINIIGNLFSKLKLPLILEAIYNKFGRQLFSTSCYNITGHIEVENALSVKLEKNEAPKIQYSIKSISFSDIEKSLIMNYFKNITGFNCSFLNDIKVSPGIHYLNAKNGITSDPIDFSGLEQFGLYTFGTYLFNESSPEHPTFDLFVNSFNKIKTI